MGEVTDRRAGSVARGAAFAGVLLVALWPRLITRRLLFASGELMQWDGDSAYHLKRIFHALSHFPSLPRFDPDMAWPSGAPCPWPDGFDLLAAAWGLVAGLGDAARGAVAVQLFTVVIALVAAWAAMDLARLVLPDGPARDGAVIAAGLLTVLLPTGVVHSQVGYVDHHVAELLAFLLLAGWALRRLPGAEGRAEVGSVRWEIGGALAATFALWVFAGGILYVAVAAAIVAFALLREERPGLVGSGAFALLAGAAAAALLNLPALRAHGRLLSYQFPSMVQPALVAGGAAALALAVAATRIARGLPGRLAALAGLVVALAVVAGLVVPSGLREVQAGLAGWLLRRDPWIASVSEFQPFTASDQPFLVTLFRTFGTLGVLAPILLPLGGWTLVRTAGARGVAFVALSAAFVLFTLNQVRFERIGQPLLIVHVVALLAAFAQRARATSGGFAVRIFPLLAGVVLVLADPFLRTNITTTWTRIPPAAPAALALRGRAGELPRRGVLTAWDEGHLVSFLSGLPTPTNGFGSYLDPALFERAEAVLRTDGPTLDAFLAERRLAFVVAGADSGTPPEMDGFRRFASGQGARGGGLNPGYMTSFGLSPLLIGGSAVVGAGVRHLERLMPIFATQDLAPGLGFALPALWVYERVPGARLVGKGPPGERIVAALEFSEQGRPHVWRAFADAGPSGDFELVVPFPTSLRRPGLGSASRYALRAGDGPPVELEVPERAVRSGETLRVGAVRGAGGPAGSKG